MAKQTDRPRAKRGRPVTRPQPEPIPDTPENVARSIMMGPPKKEWRFLSGMRDQKPRENG